MAEDRVRQAALGYVKRRLGKDARFIEATSDQDGWVARVVISERRAGRGGGAGKTWNSVYEIHLGPDLEEQYHVRRGLWDKPLPAAALEPAPSVAMDEVTAGPEPGTPPPVEPETAAPEGDGEGEADNGATARVRIGFTAPRAGAGGEGGGVEDATSEPAEIQGRLQHDREPGDVDETTGDEPREEEAASVTAGREDIPFEEKDLDFGEDGPDGDTPGGEDPGTDEPQDAIPEPGPEGPSPGEAGQATAPAEPGEPGPRPGETQGPPKVNFRFVLDAKIREPRE